MSYYSLSWCKTVIKKNLAQYFFSLMLENLFMTTHSVSGPICLKSMKKQILSHAAFLRTNGSRLLSAFVIAEGLNCSRAVAC